jgi:integrase
LRQRLEDYLALRRELGFTLVREGDLLGQFVAFAEAAGSEVVTSELALAWARLPEGANPIWVSRRLTVVRGFSRHLAVLDPTSEIIPVDLLVARVTRPTPYLYSPVEITALMATAKDLANPLKAATFETLLGLLACTGMRAGEAMRIDRGDFDPGAGLLNIWGSKFGKSRQLILHPSTVAALRRYLRRRDQLCPSPPTPALFVSSTGRRLCHAVLQPTFRDLLRRSGVGAPNQRRPRVHDLRHSFCVASLLRWYRQGDDVAAHMPALSTYLGHVNISSTYWYLSSSPELMRPAADRLEATFAGRL